MAISDPPAVIASSTRKGGGCEKITSVLCEILALAVQGFGGKELKADSTKVRGFSLIFRKIYPLIRQQLTKMSS